MHARAATPPECGGPRPDRTVSLPVATARGAGGIFKYAHQTLPYMYFVEDKRAVFLSVARCPNVKVCLEGAGPHPCCEIVQNQVITKGVVGYDDFQVPEPWVGEIDVAPILFISSNPSIGDDNAALGASSNEALWDSHHYAFGGGKGKYIIDGIFPAGANGEKLKKVAYWVFARARARELIPDAVPGQDYALTEVVH